MNQYLLIKQGNIHNAVEKEAFTADILIENGKIKKIAPVLEGAVINDAEIIDASGIDVYPGFVDAHCHLGLDGYAVEYAGDDFNEIGDAITPELSALDAVNPQDKAFELARAGGVTCVSTGPGSSNVIGGTFCVIKTWSFFLLRRLQTEIRRSFCVRQSFMKKDRKRQDIRIIRTIAKCRNIMRNWKHCSRS